MTVARFHKALILLAPLLWACYVPAPADPATMGRGEDLRVVLSDRGMEHLGAISPRVSREVTGQLTELTDDSLTLATRLRDPAYAGGSLQTIRQNLTFARSDIQEVTVSQLHRARTALVVGAGIVAVSVLLADLLEFGGGGGDGPAPPPGPSPIRIPLW